MLHDIIMILFFNPQYKFNPETGEWRQRNHQVFRDRKWLGHVTYRSGEMQFRQPRGIGAAKGDVPESLEDCLAQARQIFDKAGQQVRRVQSWSSTGKVLERWLR
jgi:hypothetical protein